MKMINVLIFLTFMCDTAYAQVIGEVVSELGNNFKYVMKDVKYPSGIDHYPYLYFGEKNLGRTSRYLILPDRGYAIFQNEETSEIFLFEVSKNDLRKVPILNKGLARRFEWNEKEKGIGIYWDDNSTTFIPFQ